jgi:dTDP-4-amino-4,6-dideoxygalactose transaminase
VTSDEKLRTMVKQIKANGRICPCTACTRMEGKCPYKDKDFDPRFIHEFIGFNFKTTEFQAALAIPQIKKADAIMRTRQKNVLYLNERLQALADVLQLPAYSEEVSYLAYPLVIRDAAIPRERFMTFLEEKGVETRPLFGCIPTQQPAFKHLKQYYAGRLPHADYVGSNAFYIGCHQYVTQADLDFVVETLFAAVAFFKNQC